MTQFNTIHLLICIILVLSGVLVISGENRGLEMV